MAIDVIRPVRLGFGSVAVSPSYTTLRTTPDLSTDIIKCIDIANSSASAVTVAVHLVEDGGTPDAANILFPDVLIEANTIVQWSGTHVLDSGGTVQATASATGVNINLSGGNIV